MGITSKGHRLQNLNDYVFGRIGRGCGDSGYRAVDMGICEHLGLESREVEKGPLWIPNIDGSRDEEVEPTVDMASGNGSRPREYRS